MNSSPVFDSVQHTSLKAFLDAPDRSQGSMSYGAAVGFLFIVACAPEPIQPSVWIPVIIDPDNATETNLENMQSIMGGLISLYNEMCRQVQEADIKLPPDCRFRDAPLMNLETDSPMSQWASGFRTGYLWLEKMWADYTPEEIREDFGYHLTVLCFFSSRDMATAFHEEVKNDSLTLEKMAENMERIFPDAMVGVATLGKSIQEVVSARGDTTSNPAAHSQKVGRNDPCTCGSGKKFKKCCGSAQPLH